MKTVSLILGDEDLEEIRRLAKKKGLGANDLLKQILSRGLALTKILEDPRGEIYYEKDGERINLK